MADLFDPERDSAELQGGIQRYRTAAASNVSEPSAEPIFRQDAKGNITDRAGRVIRPTVPPLQLGTPKEQEKKP